jgi:DNA-directed RNA polymerase specialized sigma24 family protein
MFFKERVIADAEHFSSKWAPVVLRFFQLFIGDQPVAEALAIDTLAEHIRASGAISDSEAAVPLLHRAFLKAVATNTAASQFADPIVRAVTQLEPTRRAVIVLFRGLSLDLVTIGKITGLDKVRVRRLCVEALEELRGLMGSAKPTGPVPPALREAQ